MIEFKKLDNYIPVKFGEDIVLKFKTDDESIKRLLAFGKEIEQTEEDSDDPVINFDRSKEVMHQAWDTIFGEGTFDKIYDFYDHQTLIVVQAFMQMSEAVSEEFSRRISEKAKSHYLPK